MKVYLSIDIEGIAGVTHWDEATPSCPDYEQARELMTQEAIAACEAAREAGATEVYIKDAHNNGRNILLEKLPDYVSIIRSWSGSPMGMIQELDAQFDAVAFVGWHARAGSENNPLAHTLSLKIKEIHINGEPMSEFGIYARLAEFVGVPVVFVSGDEEVCSEAKKYNTHIEVAPVSKGVGASSISVAPAKAHALIRAGLKEALGKNIHLCRTELAPKFEIEVAYSNPHDAYAASWYPGARHVGERKVNLLATDIFEIKRFLQFVS